MLFVGFCIERFVNIPSPMFQAVWTIKETITSTGVGAENNWDKERKAWRTERVRLTIRRANEQGSREKWSEWREIEWRREGRAWQEVEASGKGGWGRGEDNTAGVKAGSGPGSMRAGKRGPGVGARGRSFLSTAALLNRTTESRFGIKTEWKQKTRLHAEHMVETQRFSPTRNYFVWRVDARSQ